MHNATAYRPDGLPEQAPARVDFPDRLRKPLAALAVGLSLISLSGPDLVQAKDATAPDTPALDIPAPKGGPAGQEGMSDELTTTTWAYANVDTAPVRSWPSPHAKKARFSLHFGAPDKSPEVYRIESTWRDPQKRLWALVDVPTPHGIRKGWVIRSALGEFGVSHSGVRIDLDKHLLTMYEKGKPVLRTPVGVGAPDTPTPTGKYVVRHEFAVKKGTSFMFRKLKVSDDVFGSRIFITTAKGSKQAESELGSSMIGIHGTNQPKLIPGEISHGCIRVPNDKIRLIYTILKKAGENGTGMRVLITKVKR